MGRMDGIETWHTHVNSKTDRMDWTAQRQQGLLVLLTGRRLGILDELFLFLLALSSFFCDFGGGRKGGKDMRLLVRAVSCIISFLWWLGMVMGMGWGWDGWTELSSERRGREGYTTTSNRMGKFVN